MVPRSAVVEGDRRFLTRAQLEKVRARTRTIVAASLPQASGTIAFIDGMPSMEPTEANLRLLAVLDACSRDLGFGPVTAHDPSQRGAGDVSFVAEIVPGLDGLGALGKHEHAAGEWMDLESFPMLTRRAALLMHRVMTGC